jgi:hydrogenase large subunit
MLSFGTFDLDGKETDLTKRRRLLSQGTISTDLVPGELDASKIMEQVGHSYYKNEARHPDKGETVPYPEKSGAYSWVKSPRYDGKVYEVGPLARMLVSYAKGNVAVKGLVDGVLAHFKASPSALFSVLGRHAARALYCKYVADTMPEWLLQLKPGEPVYISYTIPEQGAGMGIVDGARGALGHWIEIKDHKIANYQCVVPSTWNMSPRDELGQAGPLEQALIGTKIKDEKNPVEVVRIVRSFDPCLACAIHLITPKGNSVGNFKVC